MEDWTKVFASSNEQEAAIIQAVLQNEEMEVVMLNRKDSSNLIYGLVELYVRNANANTALDLIKSIPIE